jgi:hypothetical protein
MFISMFIVLPLLGILIHLIARPPVTEVPPGG